MRQDFHTFSANFSKLFGRMLVMLARGNDNSFHLSSLQATSSIFSLGRVINFPNNLNFQRNIGFELFNCLADGYCVVQQRRRIYFEHWISCSFEYLSSHQARTRQDHLIQGDKCANTQIQRHKDTNTKTQRHKPPAGRTICFKGTNVQIHKDANTQRRK